VPHFLYGFLAAKREESNREMPITIPALDFGLCGRVVGSTLPCTDALFGRPLRCISESKLDSIGYEALSRSVNQRYFDSGGPRVTSKVPP